MRPGLDCSLRVVAFDVDGTLYPFRHIALRSLPLVCRYGRVFRAYGLARRALRLQRPGAALQRRQTELVAQYLGTDTAAAAALVEQVVYRRWPQAFRRLRPYPGAAATLDQLRSRGFKLGAVSDSPFTHQRLAGLGLADRWDAIVTAADAGALKPNPEPFLYLARLLQVAPEEVLFVGNSYRYDVLGAHRVGMQTAHFTRRPVAAGVATYSFAHYRSFPALEPGRDAPAPATPADGV